jgi:methylenetetrahydrofolate--tRNA-(uracil-5-)-methyltransferase
MPDLTIVGGGLAGSEAAWQAAERGLDVHLYEMRPAKPTGAHRTSYLAELVCSNSLGSVLEHRASGLLKWELGTLGSMLLGCAQECVVPAGTALAVDRDLFAQRVTQRVESHPRIRLIREEVPRIPEGLSIIASGPLTSDALARSIARFTGEANLAFFDALAPIVLGESVDMGIAFRASRNRGAEQNSGDYINCPLDKDRYFQIVELLVRAERIQLKEIEAPIDSGVRAGEFFEGCLPLEVLAGRGVDALAFGPLRPIGLKDPRTGRRPFAVVQLRQDNLAATLYNMVGFQTNLAFAEQKRVFRCIPGLEQAEFVRYGQMHRNTYVASPRVLLPTLQHRRRQDLLFAGQIMGVEGYLGNVATGLLAGINAARIFKNQSPVEMPSTTMIGALCHYATHADMRDFQPMKANFGILPSLSTKRKWGRIDRALAHSERAKDDLVAAAEMLPL